MILFVFSPMTLHHKSVSNFYEKALELLDAIRSKILLKEAFKAFSVSRRVQQQPLPALFSVSQSNRWKCIAITHEINRRRGETG